MNKRDSVYYNSEGYYDPTAGRAITNADKEPERTTEGKRGKKRKRRRKKKPCG